ncbi:hypothetical protein [Streptomyces sp. NPDC090026]
MRLPSRRTSTIVGIELATCATTLIDNGASTYVRTLGVMCARA